MLSPLRLDVDQLVIGSPWLISEALVKQHSRIDSTDSDTVLELYLKAAIQWAENETHRTIFVRENRWILRDFPRDASQAIRLPRGKTQSVTSIEYSVNGSLQTLRGPSSGSPAGTDYLEDLRGEDGGTLMPPRGGCWPSADCDVPTPVTITFQAGWAAADVPAEIVHAILFAVEDAYEIRGTGDFDPSAISSAGPRLSIRETLISGYRLSRWY
jgi:uncharacterized phiE125 gp8 family phage protein